MSRRERVRSRMGARGAGDVAPLSDNGLSPSIDLRIDHLVVDGLSASDRERFTGSLQAELVRLSAERRFPTGRAVDLADDQLTAGSLLMALPIRPAGLGRQVADLVHWGIYQLGSRSGDSPAPNGESRGGSES